MGYINSIETMGLVDGPGIRTVIFLSGCKLRCLYCHNPEMLELKSGKAVSPKDIVDTLKNYKNYYGENGGVTFSGGEPLLQPDFLIETMKLCHEEGINTCLDTAGCGTSKDEEVLKYTDLVILDIKACNAELYNKITRAKMDNFNKFLKLCQKLNKPLWLRQVIVPGINDTEESILELKAFINRLNNVEKVELIPYHTYGEEKYDKLQLKYPLKGTKALEVETLQKLENILKKDW